MKKKSQTERPFYPNYVMPTNTSPSLLASQIASDIARLHPNAASYENALVNSLATTLLQFESLVQRRIVERVATHVGQMASNLIYEIDMPLRIGTPVFGVPRQTIRAKSTSKKRGSAENAH